MSFKELKSQFYWREEEIKKQHQNSSYLIKSIKAGLMKIIPEFIDYCQVQYLPDKKQIIIVPSDKIIAQEISLKLPSIYSEVKNKDIEKIIIQ